MASIKKKGRSMKADEDIHVGLLTVLKSKEIGRGAYGIVYRGRFRYSESKEESIAIKVIANYTKSGNVVRESDILHKLSHPNIIRVLRTEYNPATDTFYLGMEHCQLSLLAWCNQQKPSPDPNHLENALNILEGINHGLIYLHSHSIIHRDLAARNVLLHEKFRAEGSGDGTSTMYIPKICDFGISKPISHGDETTDSQESHYSKIIASEFKNKISTKFDMHEFGILIYEVLALKTCPSIIPPLDMDYLGIVETCNALLNELEPRKRPSALQLMDYPLFKYRKPVAFLGYLNNIVAEAAGDNANKVMSVVNSVPIVSKRGYRDWKEILFKSFPETAKVEAFESHFKKVNNFHRSKQNKPSGEQNENGNEENERYSKKNTFDLLKFLRNCCEHFGEHANPSRGAKQAKLSRKKFASHYVKLGSFVHAKFVKLFFTIPEFRPLFYNIWRAYSNYKACISGKLRGLTIQGDRQFPKRSSHCLIIVLDLEFQRVWLAAEKHGPMSHSVEISVENGSQQNLFYYLLATENLDSKMSMEETIGYYRSHSFDPLSQYFQNLKMEVQKLWKVDFTYCIIGVSFRFSTNVKIKLENAVKQAGFGTNPVIIPIASAAAHHLLCKEKIGNSSEAYIVVIRGSEFDGTATPFGNNWDVAIYSARDFAFLTRLSLPKSEALWDQDFSVNKKSFEAVMSRFANALANTPLYTRIHQVKAILQCSEECNLFGRLLTVLFPEATLYTYECWYNSNGFPDPTFIQCFLTLLTNQGVIDYDYVQSNFLSKTTSTFSFEVTGGSTQYPLQYIQKGSQLNQLICVPLGRMCMDDEDDSFLARVYEHLDDFNKDLVLEYRMPLETTKVQFSVDERGAPQVLPLQCD